MNIPVLEKSGYEADDVIGTLAKKAGEMRSIDTFMITPDKDYGQLVEENVRMYRPRFGGGYEIMGPQEVMEKYGLASPQQVIDLLGLMGDASDNIPGCPGVGEKTAIKLISEFGSIENLIASTDKLKGAIKKKVEENINQIKFSKFLATIKIDVPIELNLDELKYEEPNEEELEKIFAELEFKSLTNKILKKSNFFPFFLPLSGFSEFFPCFCLFHHRKTGVIFRGWNGSAISVFPGDYARIFPEPHGSPHRLRSLTTLLRSSRRWKYNDPRTSSGRSRRAIHQCPC